MKNFFRLITLSLFFTLYCESFYIDEETTSLSEDIALQNYPIAIPLGSNCRPSCIILKNNLRRFAYPLDWMLISFESVIKLIENDFKYFLDEEFLYLKNHFVTNKLYDCQFPHAFEKKSWKDDSWKNDLPKVQTMFNRRINRFFKALKTKKHLYFIHEGATITPMLAEKLCTVIEKKCNHKNYTLAIIGNNLNYHYYSTQHPHIKFYFLNLEHIHLGYRNPELTKHIIKDLGLGQTKTAPKQT